MTEIIKRTKLSMSRCDVIGLKLPFQIVLFIALCADEAVMLGVSFTAEAPLVREGLSGYSGLSPEGREAAISTGLRPEEVEHALGPVMQ
eukprot:scaffold280818_cov42-Prasinocladus_malaysianus.AAC.1